MGTDSKAPKLSFELWLGLGVAKRPHLWRLVLRFEIEIKARDLRFDIEVRELRFES